jgi:hypothetical protein
MKTFRVLFEVHLKLSLNCPLVTRLNICSFDNAFPELLICKIVEFVNRGAVLFLQLLVKFFDTNTQHLMQLSDNVFVSFAH